MNNSKFLGICILIAAIAVSLAIVFHARAGRYQFHPSAPPGVLWEIDTTTGEVSVVHARTATN